MRCFSYFALLCTPVLLLALNAVAQQAQLGNDNRSVGIDVVGSGLVEDFIFNEQVDADFGQPFDETVGESGLTPAGGFEYDALASQNSFINFLTSNRFEIEGSLDAFGLGSRHAGTEIIDTGLASGESTFNMTIHADMPVDYEIELFMDLEGDGLAQFNAFDVSRTIPLDFTPGTTEHFSGRAPAGEHELSASAFGIYDLITDSGSTASVDFRITGHVIPAPAAVGPGLVLLGGLFLRRQRHNERETL